MAQGEFTKQEAHRMADAVQELFEGIPKTRRMGFLGHLNDILLFLATAEREAPDKPGEDT